MVYVASIYIESTLNCAPGAVPHLKWQFDTFEEVERKADAADQLCVELCERYPHVTVGRPSRLLDTVKRLIAPTQPNALGPAKLTGSPLAHYRRRVWEPHMRTTGTGELCNFKLKCAYE